MVTGKLGRAWVGAWVVHVMVHGMVCVLLGWGMLDVGVGSGLVGDGVKVLWENKIGKDWFPDQGI